MLMRLFCQNITREKLRELSHKALSYEKHARKMLMKLTLGLNNKKGEDVNRSDMF